MEEHICKDTSERQLELFEQFILLRVHIEQFLAPIAHRYNLTPSGVFFLYLISKQPNFNISRACRKMNLNQGNASSMCKKLESSGFIKRTRDKNDERVFNIVLTNYGKETLAAIAEKIGNSVSCAEHKNNTSVLEMRIALERLCGFMEVISEKIL